MALADGSTFGPYRITGRLGRGGMATVYRAYEAGLDRYVALKTLPDDALENETAVKRFQLEARAVARLVHPNIVPVLAFGIEEATRTPWMALQLIEGGSLAMVLAQGRVDPRRALGFLRGIANALDYAHGNGVLHRDVKPQNVLVAAGDHPYLADFGLARILERSTVLSVAGTVLGTPQYMAPEQALGQELDYRCDIYALGIMAYELLSGAPPFQADTPLELLMKHIRDPIPIPPVERVGEPLLQPLLKALAKDRNDRWGTARSFVEALETGLAEARTQQVVVPATQRQPPVPTRDPIASTPPEPEATLAPPEEQADDLEPARATLAEVSRRRSRGPVLLVLGLFAIFLALLAGVATIVVMRFREPVAEVVPTTTVAPSTLPTPSVAPTTTEPPQVLTPSPSAAPGVIHVRSSIEGASVTLDDANPILLPADLSLSPGKHRLEVTKTGCQPSRQWLQVPAGETRRVNVELSCPTPTPAIAQASPLPTPSLKPVEAAPAYRAGEVKAFGDGSYVWVPGGAFMMGCTPGDSDCGGDESPRHRVKLTSGYFMARTAVTVSQYKRSGKTAPPSAGFSQADDHPVVNVTWTEANAYCQGMGGRLPTEAEWERAARGGHDDWRFPWGNSITHENANYGNDKCCSGYAEGRDRWVNTAPVGSFAANDLGLVDMAGNVWEWSADAKREYSFSEVTDPRGGEGKRVVRGGSWHDYPRNLRVSVRSGYGAGFRFNYVGFRCVRDATP